MPFSPSNVIFLPNSEKFPFALCRVTRIFRVEITSRSPLYLANAGKLFRNSHLNVSYNIAKYILPPSTRITHITFLSTKES